MKVVSVNGQTYNIGDYVEFNGLVHDNMKFFEYFKDVNKDKAFIIVDYQEMKQGSYTKVKIIDFKENEFLISCDWLKFFKHCDMC